MRVRVLGVLIVSVAILTACGSSSKSGSDAPSGSTPTADVDVQAAVACKTMEKSLSETTPGQTISGPNAAAMLKDFGVLIRTPEGNTPTTADPIPKWYLLGTVQVSLMNALADGDTATIDDLTAQARALCVTIPEDAQKSAKYTPVNP